MVDNMVKPQKPTAEEFIQDLEKIIINERKYYSEMSDKAFGEGNNGKEMFYTGRASELVEIQMLINQWKVDHKEN